MLKKLIPIVVLLCLMFSLSAIAENINELTYETAPEVSQQIPQDSRGEMRMPNGDIPPSMPNREMHQNGNPQFGGQMPGGMGRFPGNMQNENPETQEEQPKGFLGFVKTYSTPITSVILLIFAFIFVIFYRRKNY